MTPDRLADINRALQHARGSAFYRDRLPGAPLRSLEEFRLVPLTTKADLRRLPPRALVSVPERELRQYCESSATTGVPIAIWYSERDLAEIRERLALWGVGLTAEDRVLVKLPYALSTIGHMIHAAAQHAGACVIAADEATAITPLMRVLALMQKLDVTVLACLSLSAVLLAEAAEAAGLDPRRDFPGLRAICCAGEPMTPYRRQLLQGIWGVPVFDNYGMTETGPQATDCPEHRLHPWHDLFWMEILDDALEEEVAPGETGHLVVTSLTPRATPMIRYATGDRVRRLQQPCACGRDTSLEIRGRADDVLWIQGRPFGAWELQAIVSRLPSRRFWKVAPLEDGLRFVVERERGEDRIEGDRLDELQHVFGVRLEVHLVRKGTLYDRDEPVGFGLVGKPSYVLAPGELG